jgi:hypothetical protein
MREPRDWDPRILDLRQLLRRWDDILAEEWLPLVRSTRYDNYLRSLPGSRPNDPRWDSSELWEYIEVLEEYVNPRHELHRIALTMPERISWGLEGHLQVAEELVPVDARPREFYAISRGARKLELVERLRGILPRPAGLVPPGQEKREIWKCRCLKSGFVCNRCALLAKRPGTWRGDHLSIWSVFGGWFLPNRYSYSTRLLFRELDEELQGLGCDG